MSILIGNKAYQTENKRARRSQITSKHVKIPSNYKSRKCSLQLKNQRCHMANHIVISGVQTFHLCQKHFEQFMAKSTPGNWPVIFQKARDYE